MTQSPKTKSCTKQDIMSKYTKGPGIHFDSDESFCEERLESSSKNYEDVIREIKESAAGDTAKISLINAKLECELESESRIIALACLEKLRKENTK